jgi:hypothetical protein
MSSVVHPHLHDYHIVNGVLDYSATAASCAPACRCPNAQGQEIEGERGIYDFVSRFQEST